MIRTNQEIAARAREITSGPDGPRRRAALCVLVAAGETGTLATARKSLNIVRSDDLRAAAVALLDELASDDGQLHD